MKPYMHTVNGTMTFNYAKFLRDMRSPYNGVTSMGQLRLVNDQEDIRYYLQSKRAEARREIVLDPWLKKLPQHDAGVLEAILHGLPYSIREPIEQEMLTRAGRGCSVNDSAPGTAPEEDVQFVPPPQVEAQGEAARERRDIPPILSSNGRTVENPIAAVSVYYDQSSFQLRPQVRPFGETIHVSRLWRPPLFVRGPW